MSTRNPAFVLIHGAWHGEATWKTVTPLLEARRHRARTLDLPGAGALARMPLSYGKRPLDRARFAAELSPNAVVTQEQRTRAVIRLVEETATETGGPVVLVGHSLGGVTVTAVAEAIPDRLHAVIYLSAFLLTDGMAARDMIGHEAFASSALPSLLLADPRTVGALRIDFRSREADYRSKLRSVFAADVGEKAFAAALATLHCDEPASAVMTPTRLTAVRFGQVPRHYIRCLQDQAIPPSGQDLMVAALDISVGTPTHVHDLDASHSPFHSQPAALADLLVSIASSSERPSRLVDRRQAPVDEAGHDNRNIPVPS